MCSLQCSLHKVIKEEQTRVVPDSRITQHKQCILRRETQQFLDRSVDGWKMVSAPPNTSLT